MAHSKNIQIKINSITLPGILTMPKRAKAIVFFAHGSGSSRLSPRNSYIAKILEKAGIGSLLFDLLTEEEDLVVEKHYDIDLISGRLRKAIDFILNGNGKNLAVGVFGADTGAAAAIKAAEANKKIKAMVCRAGRTDLVFDLLSKIKPPTLFIVGEYDKEILDINMEAFDNLKTIKKLSVIHMASHLFEEKGALEQVANLTVDWFKNYLVKQYK